MLLLIKNAILLIVFEQRLNYVLMEPFASVVELSKIPCTGVEGINVNELESKAY